MLKSAFAALALSASVLITATAAQAADPYVAPAYDWNGGYIGLTAGYGFGDYLLNSASGNGPKVKVDNFVFGATAGYNFQPSSSWLLGVEADISSGVDGTRPVGTVGPFWSCNTGKCNVDVKYFGTLRGRVGITSDAFLLYGTGGLAYANYDGGIKNSAQQGSDSSLGWTLGAGVEYGINANLSAKLEYLHVDVGSLNFGTGIGTERFRGKGDFDVVRAGLNWQF
jgi:outer membrane immunogenic protein